MKNYLLITLLLTVPALNAQCWKSISVGELHSVGIKTDNTLWSFGQDGGWGRLGAGNTFVLTTPTQISTTADWKEVYATDYHNVAIKNNGTLWAWGDNSDGQLGDGTLITKNVPTQIGTDQWKMVRAGRNHSVGIKQDGTLWAWGDNQKATLGDGTFVNKIVPTLINSGTNWKMVSCNIFRNIAIKEDGTLWVWGSNSPALGVENMGSSTAYITIPTQVGTDTDWEIATAGNGYFLALKNDHTLWVWGGGANGCLGNGSTTGIFLPTQMGTATDWQIVEADAFSSFGLKIDHSLYAWGRNMFGNLGDGTQTDLLVPTQITTANDWKMVGVSASFTAALQTDGSLYTWGYNGFGSLGDGTYEDQLTPQLINQCTLSTEDFNKSKVLLYPNPVQNHLFIDTQKPQTYQIYSILGVKIIEGRLSVGSSIDCSNLTSGVYLLSLTDNEGLSKTVKFVKQ